MKVARDPQANGQWQLQPEPMAIGTEAWQLQPRRMANWETTERVKRWPMAIAIEANGNGNRGV